MKRSESSDAAGEIGRITVVHAATQRAARAPATALGILPGTRVPSIEWTLEVWCPVQQECDLNRRNEKGMSVFAETTTPAAELTDRPEAGDLRVELIVEGSKFAPEFRPVAGIVGDAQVCFGNHFRIIAWRIGSRITVDAASARPRTDRSHALPVLGGLDVLRPERPGLALRRRGGIHRAAGLLVPEDAIPSRLLDQAEPITHQSDEARGELLDCLAAKLRELLDLFGQTQT